MVALQVSCIAIVSLFLVVRLRTDREPRRLAARLFAFMVAGWIAENIVIHLHHFYRYDTGWWLIADQVPLLVAMIWPIVIQSAYDLARDLTRGGRAWALAAVVVLLDASLIEQIAVAAGLWTWSAPGLFTVPLIGICGWAVFAACALFVVERGPQRLLIPVAALLPQVLLVGLWWALFRWIPGEVSTGWVAGAAWALSIAAAGVCFVMKLGRRVQLKTLLLRLPAAGFFFVLLLLNDHPPEGLMVYAFAFAPPYLVLTAQAGYESARA